MQGRLRILVIEDDADFRQALSDVLEKNGFDVDVAEDGISALNKLWVKNYDLALTDIILPGMSGFKLMSIARSIPPQLDFLVMSGNASLEHREEARRLGAKGFLEKPFTPQQLISVVKNLRPDPGNGSSF